MEFDYKSLFENAGVGIFLCDREGNIIIYNTLFDTLFGKFKIKNILDLPEEGYREALSKVLQIASEGYAGVPYPFTFWTSIGGNRRKYEINISRQPASDNFIVSIYDITRRAEAYDELSRRNRELSCLLKIQQLTSSSFKLSDIYRTTINESCKIFNFPAGFILMPDNTNTLRIVSYYSDQPISEDTIKHIEEILNTGRIVLWTREKFKTILINERAINEITDGERELLSIFNVSSIVSVPVVVKGEITGFIIFARRESHNLFFDQVSVIETLAHQIGISIQNAILFETTEKIKERAIRQNESLNLMYRIGLMYFRNLAFDEMMREVKSDFFRITGFDGVNVYYKKNDRPFLFHYFRDESFNSPCHGDTHSISVLEAIKSTIPNSDYIYIEDVSNSTHLPYEIRVGFINCNIKSMFITPLREREKKIGLLIGFTFNNIISATSEDISLWTSLAVFLESLLNNYDFRNELEIREKELSLLSKKLITAQEDEKKRIAREIHDSLGQLIYTLNINMSILGQENNITNDPVFLKSQEIIRHIQEDIRRISYELRPPTLDEMGLVSSIRWLIDQVKNPEIKFTLGTNLTSPITFPYPVQVQIFRIAQEAITNILKHSKASEANIFLYENESSFFMEITDNGIGISQDNSQQGGIGIIGMKERAISIGGHLKIESSKETGTTIVLEIPK